MDKTWQGMGRANGIKQEGRQKWKRLGRAWKGQDWLSKRVGKTWTRQGRPWKRQGRTEQGGGQKWIGGGRAGMEKTGQGMERA